MPKRKKINYKQLYQQNKKISWILFFGLILFGSYILGDYFGAWTIFQPDIIPEEEDEYPIPDDSIIKENEYTYDNENYYLYINTKSKFGSSTIYMYLEDKSIDENLNYIFIEGSLYNNSGYNDSIQLGSNSFKFIYENSYLWQYDVIIHFFDTISGNRIEISSNLKNLTILEGNISEYTETIPMHLNLTNANGDLLSEYEPLEATNFLYHFNESYGEPIDSSFNNWDSVRVGILPDNMYGAIGKFGTDAYLFNRGLQQGINIDSNYNFTNLISIDFWFDKDSFGNTNYNESVFSRNDSSIFAGFRYQQTGKLKYFHFHLIDEYDNEYILEYEYEILLTQYYHVGFTYDNETMRIFLDGDIVATNEIGSINIKQSNENYTIGYRDSTNYYNGILEELKVCNVNVTQFTENLRNLYYTDNLTLDLNTTNGYLEFITSFNSFFLGSNLEHFKIDVEYYNTNNSINITNEELFIFNFNNDSWVKFNYDCPLIEADNYTSDLNEIRILTNYTGNDSIFILEFDSIICTGYHEINTTNLEWSYYSDDTRVILFMSETTNRTSFITEFELSPLINIIFDSITYYEMHLIEGNFSIDTDLSIYLYNYTNNEWIYANDIIEINEYSDNDDIIFSIESIPYEYYFDIIEPNSTKEKIAIQFDFYCETPQIYLDWIQKYSYYMDVNDIIDIVHSFDVRYYP